MLHSTIPRAFATPGLKYLGGYYEDALSYPVPGFYPEDHFYPGISNEHHWHTVQRPASPCPLDLSVKPTRPNVVVVEDPGRCEGEEEEAPGYKLLMTPHHHLHAPMTPPSTPSPPQCPRKRAREDTVAKPPRGKKKLARRLKFDEDTSSPVSGTVILGPDEAVVTGDIDPAFNVVEVTEEARAELAKIENRLGPYQCRLCRQLHEDAFQLAQHRCSRIAHVEYRCPECDKRFSCPANLASHRRWHKPRVPPGESSTANVAADFACSRCDARFGRQAALRKHVASQHQDTGSGGSTASSSSQLAVSPVTVEVTP